MRIHTRLGRAAAALSSGAVLATSAIVLVAPPAAAQVVVTDYGLQSSAYGTRVTSNSVALNVGRTAFAWIGCTRKAGLNPANHPVAGNVLAAADAPTSNPLVTLGAVTSTNESFRDRQAGVIGITATNRIASITLRGPDQAQDVPGPMFRVEGLVTKATAYARKGTLKGETALRSGDLELVLPEGTPVAGTPVEDLLGAVDDGLGAVIDVLDGAAGNAIEVPGLGVVRLGVAGTQTSKNSATAYANALIVDLVGQDGQLNTVDDSTIHIGRSRARINRGLPAGVMGGNGYGLDLSAADGTLRLGKIGLENLPCQGTRGEVRGIAVPAQDVFEGALELGTMNAAVYGLQELDRSGSAWTMGKVARVALGSGEERLELKGIVGAARVRKKASGGLVRSTRGTQVGSLTIGGEEHAFPTDGSPMELPGLGKAEFNLVERTGSGVRVTAVRLTLMPGEIAPTETVLNLGVARVSIKRA